MNWDRIEGNWKQFTGTAKAKWGKITDDQLAVIGGKRDQLAGRIQEAYGVTKEAAQRQIDQWQSDQREQVSDDERGEQLHVRKELPGS
jgi:uncharacterized protein YjbJ (UPF0337 family)